MEENNRIIAENNRINRSLQEQNEMYKELSSSLSVNLELSENKVQDIVAILIGKKIF